MVLDPAGPSPHAARSSSVSTAGWSEISVTPGGSSNSARSTRRPRAGRARHHVVGEHHALLGGEPAEREAGDALGGLVAEPHRQPEVDRQLEVDVEEVGPGLERAEVAGEVAHVEAPHDRPLDLGPALAADLVEVGVVPGVLDRAGEAAVAVEQARRVGDRAPAVGVELGVEGEVHADVFAPVAGGGVAGPGHGTMSDALEARP